MLVAIPILINGAFVLLGSIFGAKTAVVAATVEVANREAGYKRGEGYCTKGQHILIDPSDPGLGKHLYEVCEVWMPEWVGKTLSLTDSEIIDVGALLEPVFAGTPPSKALPGLIRYLEALPKWRFK